MPVHNHPLSPEQVMAYLDGELHAREMSQASEHLAHCRECQTLAAEFQALSGELTAWDVTPPSPDLVHCPPAVPNREMHISVEGWRSFWSRYRLQAIAGLAALLLFVAAAGLSRRPESSPPGARLVPLALSASNAEGQSANGSQILAFRSEDRSKLRTMSVQPQSAVEAAVNPMVARTAQLRITVKDFSPVRDSVMKAVTSEGGYISRLEINQPPSVGQALTAWLQVPSQRLDATLTALKHLGRVESESQTGEDVSKQVVDVDARLSNLRSEEARLNQIMKDRTGRLSDVLAVEEQISNVRGQIESSQAEQTMLAGRVRYASLEVTINEEYAKSLTNNQAPSTPTRLHNAAVEGIQQLENLAIGTLIFFLAYGPSLVLALALIFLLFKLNAHYRRRPS